MFWLMVAGTFIWVYFGSIRGLLELGKESLKLKSFREDKTLGARPIGVLSFSFASIYVIGMGLVVFMVIIIIPQSSTFLFSSLLAFLILIGIAFFFLPLYTVHKRMQEAKQLEQETLRQQYIKVHERLKASESSQQEVSEALDRLTNIITIDVSKAEVEAIPTWPVDASILSRLVTLIFSIIGIIIANYVMNFVLDWI
jgi:ABC-type bacteriocin/lantibiotic exporter with double-glycine peptidase domain